MYTLKKFFSIVFIFVILLTSFNISYLMGDSFVYADSEGWENCSSLEDQAKAFRAYCKSRDLTIEGSVADAVTTFTSDTYRKIVDKLGLNIDAIGSQVKKAYDSSNGGTKYLFTSQGAGFYSQIFSQFLYDNNLEVGDSANQNDNTLYSGEIFIDSEGYSSLVYLSTVMNNWSNDIVIGTPWKFTTDDIVNLSKVSGFIDIDMVYVNNTYSISAVYTESFDQSNHVSYTVGTTSSQNQFYRRRYTVGSSVLNPTSSAGRYNNGNVGIIKYQNKYYYGIYYESLDYSQANGFSLYRKYVTSMTQITAGEAQSAIVYLFSPTINNNNYGGNTYTEINNNGDVNNYDTDDEPPITPPDPSDPSAPDWGIDLPEMPNDWLIYGLEKKFPFDIPFNILFALSLLNAEPEAPHFEGDIDLKIVTWHYDFDFTQFESLARIFREFMFLAFIIGLMIMTKQLIWG